MPVTPQGDVLHHASGRRGPLASRSSSASLFASRLEVWRENQPDGARDHAVIDAWAELLGISGWYAWLTDEGDDSTESER